MQTSTAEDVSVVATAHRSEHLYCARSTADARKRKGQVFTPPAVARFMAGMLTKIPPTFRLLDPGAGIGVLTAAVCDRISVLDDPRRVHVTAFETDEAVIPLLKDTLNRCESLLHLHGHTFTHDVITEDFLLHASRQDAPRSLFADDINLGRFDAAIVNPPYFKIGGDSRYAKLLPSLVHGQPNIYALFLAMAAQLLHPNAELVAITPRSFCNGLYFREFRRWFFQRMSLSQLHLFESRTETFKEAKVLQESVVTLSQRTDQPASSILITRSFGRDLDGDLDPERLPTAFVVDKSSPDCQIRVPELSADTKLLEQVDRWPWSFSELGLRISTGPVVMFRTTKYLLPDVDVKSVPLLSVHNVHPFKTVWPTKRNGKPLAFRLCDGSLKYLVPSRNYVLLRRFSSKEERRRLTASCLFAGFEGATHVALENHINYVYHESRELSVDEMFGVAALFNSTLLDRYFRAISGNTQVNATEVRVMRFLDLATIARIGKQARMASDPSQQIIDDAVCAELDVSGEAVSAYRSNIS